MLPVPEPPRTQSLLFPWGAGCSGVGGYGWGSVGQCRVHGAGGDGGAPVGNYEYSTDNGANWTARVPAATVFAGGGRQVEQRCDVSGEAACGECCRCRAASDAVAVVPRGVPGAPSGWLVWRGIRGWRCRGLRRCLMVGRRCPGMW